MIQKGLTSTQLKLIAIFAMLLDHFVGLFFGHDTIWTMALRIPGRIVAPIMCYMISEGFFYTSDKRKYLVRMLLFAVISHIPFNLCMGTGFPTTSVMWSLSMGLAALTMVKKEGIHWLLKVVCAALCCLFAYTANWNYVAVLWIVSFGIFHGNFKKQIISFCLIGFFFHVLPTFTYREFGFQHNLPHWYQIFIFAAIPLLKMYNGQKGTASKLMSRFFYWFYPAHLLLLYFLYQIIY